MKLLKTLAGSEHGCNAVTTCYLVLSWSIRPHYKQIQSHHTKLRSLPVHLLIPDSQCVIELLHCIITCHFIIWSHLYLCFCCFFIYIFFYYESNAENDCRTSLMKRWFVPTKQSMSEVFQVLNNNGRWDGEALGRGMKTNKWTTKKSEMNEKRKAQEKEVKTGRRRWREER